jgi:hypothetical protein
MRWFRFYSQALHDSKVQTLPADLFRVWVNLLCIANENADRGLLPDLGQIAYSLHVKEDKAAQYVEQLIRRGLISPDDRGSLRPHNWDKWQHKSDDVTDRVREHRRRKNDTAMKQDETFHPPPRNVTETFHPPPRNVTETPRVRDRAEARAGDRAEARPRSDTDTDTDTEEPPYGGGAAGAAAVSKGPSPGPPLGLDGAAELARGRFGDAVAAMLVANGPDIAATLGGRFDLYLAALGRARDYGKPIRDLHRFAIALARQYARTGLPADPVPLAPSNGTNGHVLRAKAQDDAFERALEEIDEC